MSTSSIKEFADDPAQEPCLDVAIFNAGTFATSYQLSPAAYEISPGHGSFDSTAGYLLLPNLQRSAEAAGTPADLELVGSIVGRSLKADNFLRDAEILGQANEDDFSSLLKIPTAMR